MATTCANVEQHYWIHLLLRGDQRQTENEEDEYTAEFKRNNLIALTIPVLKFKFKNLNLLSDALTDLKEGTATAGLIVTSPRVVESLLRAIQVPADDASDQKLNWDLFSILQKRINPNLVFVVGEKTGRECEKKLGLNYNTNSSQTGNSRALGEYIKKTVQRDPSSRIHLIYPKGSRSDTVIEEALVEVTNTSLQSFVVYDTEPIDNIDSIVIDEISKLSIPADTVRFSVNMIFFSPSGVEALSKTWNFTNYLVDTLQTKIVCKVPGCEIDLFYSSIGKTTEAALLRLAGLKVFCVAEKPKPLSLVQSILKAISNTVKNKIQIF